MRWAVSVTLIVLSILGVFVASETPKTGPVAFSAYLDQDLSGLKVKDRVTFNKVNYNEGNYYNVATGVFTAPEPGLYFFTYVVAYRGGGEVNVELVLNGVQQNQGVAEGTQARHDAQGGNSVILKMKKGDRVWISVTWGNWVGGQYRFSSFVGYKISNLI